MPQKIAINNWEHRLKSLTVQAVELLMHLLAKVAAAGAAAALPVQHPELQAEPQ